MLFQWRGGWSDQTVVTLAFFRLPKINGKNQTHCPGCRKISGASRLMPKGSHGLNRTRVVILQWLSYPRAMDAVSLEGRMRRVCEEVI